MPSSTPRSPETPTPSPQRREAQRPSGWDRYLSVLERHRVPASQRQWYVRRVEAFVEAVRPTRIGEVSAGQVTAFFHRYAREQRLTEWQFRQMVDAVQLLLVDLARSPAAGEIDWDYWKDAAKELGAGHPTVAAEQPPEQAVQGNPRYARSAERYPVLKTLARTLRARRYAIRTEQTYVDWCHRFLCFAGREDADGLGQADVERFLAHLAADRNVSASTQNQALNALVFLFKEVLGRPLGEMRFARARRPPRVPVVLSRDEMRALLARLSGTYALMAHLMYGTGMRLMECVRVRVGDLDFGNGLIVVRNGKGGKDPGGAAAGAGEGAVEGAPGGGAGTARRGFGRRCRRSVPSGCPRAQGSQCATGVGLAVRVPEREAVDGPERGSGASPPPGRVGPAEGDQAGGAGCPPGQAGHQSYAPPLLRNAPPGGRL